MATDNSDKPRASLFPLAALAAGALSLMTAFPAFAEAEKPPEISSQSAVPVEPQIVGGNPVNNQRWRRNFRWVVALVDSSDNRQFCGGSLIAPEWVLTAAHCLHETAPRDVSVRVGSPLVSGGGRVVPVVGVVPHPGYVEATYENDIALLRLAEPVDLPNVIRATPAMTNRLAAPGRRTLALGWGALREGAPGPNRLHQVSVPVVSLRICQRDYPNDNIFRTFLCAGFAAGGRDSCQGDSGGPLAVNTPQGWAQVGVTSWGNGCARPRQYGVYTRVASYNGWINAVMAGAQNCIDQTLPRVIRRPNGFNCYAMPGNDDWSVGPVELGFEVRIGNTRYDSIYINNNGNLTFGDGMSTFTPRPLVEMLRPVIAPFFADVDTSGNDSGVVFYGQGNVAGRRSFSVIWQRVGYWPQRTDLLNTFQVVLSELAPGSGNFRIEFNYASLQWETGGASGGVDGLGGDSARAGFSLEPSNAARAVELRGSARPGWLIDGGRLPLVSRSNTGVPGRFAWTVRGGVQR